MNNILHNAFVFVPLRLQIEQLKIGLLPQHHSVNIHFVPNAKRALRIFHPEGFRGVRRKSGACWYAFCT